MTKISLLPHHHTDDSLLSEIPDIEEIAVVSEAMKQLGDPARLQIFWILCHCEECVANLAAMVNMTSPAVSHHLRVLKDHNLVTAQRRGKEVYYQASHTPLVDSLHHTIEDIAKIACPQKPPLP